VAAGSGHGGHAVVSPEDLPGGAVVTGSGRVSAAEVHRDAPRTAHPFSASQMARLDEALTLTTRETGLRFSVYLGDLGAAAAERAAELHDELAGAGEAVLLAVDPQQREVHVVTGPEARVRLPDRGAKLAIMSMVVSFKEGDLHGGLMSGLRMLADQAGGRPRTH
jgi:uncharacterized membrane protein YgcG